MGTCHHRGTVNSGHWITKVLTNGGWHELDDLVGKSLVTSPPGVSDDSVTIILLIAEDKLVYLVGLHSLVLCVFVRFSFLWLFGIPPDDFTFFSTSSSDTGRG